VVVQGRARVTVDVVARAVEETGAALDAGSLLGRRSGTVVLLAHGPVRWDEFHAALVHQLGSGACAVGVGGRAERPSDLPRSCREALLSLNVRQSSLQPDGVTSFDELGIYRVLAATENSAEVGQFVREWLGPLLDYDAKHGAELVKTLAQYLECGGNYDETAEVLDIHRSTLRYRLQRIRDVSGLELNDVDSRFNLHVATRAWKVLGGAR
jgi:DNA-binding PucR family transcriptional regulator